jgi:hypothetical protein
MQDPSKDAGNLRPQKGFTRRQGRGERRGTFIGYGSMKREGAKFHRPGKGKPRFKRDDGIEDGSRD